MTWQKKRKSSSAGPWYSRRNGFSIQDRKFWGLNRAEVTKVNQLKTAFAKNVNTIIAKGQQ